MSGGAHCSPTIASDAGEYRVPPAPPFLTAGAAAASCQTANSAQCCAVRATCLMKCSCGRFRAWYQFYEMRLCCCWAQGLVLRARETIGTGIWLDQLRLKIYEKFMKKPPQSFNLHTLPALPFKIQLLLKTNYVMIFLPLLIHKAPPSTSSPSFLSQTHP